MEDPGEAAVEVALAMEVDNVIIEDVTMELEDEDIDPHPTPIAVWQELVEKDGSVGVDADLLWKSRRCQIPGDEGDESRRIPGQKCLEYAYIHIITIKTKKIQIILIILLVQFKIQLGILSRVHQVCMMIHPSSFFTSSS